MSGWAASERQVMVALLRDAGPDAPVVPAGWTTADLAAHLYVRERRPDAALGVAVPGPFASYTDRVMASALRVEGYDGLVSRIAAGPPLVVRPVDDLVNLTEFFVHVEDVRRAAGEGPRELPGDLDNALWGALRRSARLMFRRVHGIRVQLHESGGQQITVGRGPVTVRLAGRASELLLYASGRKPQADVHTTGDGAVLLRLERARLGL